MAKKNNPNETTDEQAEIRPLTPEEAKEAAEMADAPDLTGIAISEEEMGDEVTAVDADYGAGQIQVLEGLEAVRKRIRQRQHIEKRNMTHARHHAQPSCESKESLIK